MQSPTARAAQGKTAGWVSQPMSGINGPYVIRLRRRA
jgi:hypothetical protein